MNLRRHEPDPKSDRTWRRAAREVNNLHSHASSITCAPTRGSRREQNASTREHVSRARPSASRARIRVRGLLSGRARFCRSQAHYFEVSDPGPRDFFVDLDELQRLVWPEPPLSNCAPTRETQREQSAYTCTGVAKKFRAVLAVQIPLYSRFQTQVQESFL